MVHLVQIWKTLLKIVTILPQVEVGVSNPEVFIPTRMQTSTTSIASVVTLTHTTHTGTEDSLDRPTTWTVTTCPSRMYCWITSGDMLRVEPIAKDTAIPDTTPTVEVSNHSSKSYPSIWNKRNYDPIYKYYTIHILKSWEIYKKRVLIIRGNRPWFLCHYIILSK